MMENLTEEGGLRDFFASCFSKSENRPSAKALLSHRFLQFDTNPSDHTSLEKKLTMMDSNNHSVRLTTDDINDAALSIIKLRAKKPLTLSAHSVDNFVENAENFQSSGVKPCQEARRVPRNGRACFRGGRENLRGKIGGVRNFSQHLGL